MKSTSFWNTVEFILAQKDAAYGCSSKQGFTVKYNIPIFSNNVCIKIIKLCVFVNVLSS